MLLVNSDVPLLPEHKVVLGVNSMCTCILCFEFYNMIFNTVHLQDLPNYAQHAVPIFSLPQEWLWCESWCGNATKSRAKTIDLCNNPMTKEPKLQVRMLLSIFLVLGTSI